MSPKDSSEWNRLLSPVDDWFITLWILFFKILLQERDSCSLPLTHLLFENERGPIRFFFKNHHAITNRYSVLRLHTLQFKTKTFNNLNESQFREISIKCRIYTYFRCIDRSFTLPRNNKQPAIIVISNTYFACLLEREFLNLWLTSGCMPSPTRAYGCEEKTVLLFTTMYF